MAARIRLWHMITAAKIYQKKTVLLSSLLDSQARIL